MMEHEMGVVQQAVRQAGQAVLRLAADGFETHIKMDRSPVTTADLTVNRVLHEVLREGFPNDAWLSEETPDDPVRLSSKRVWVLDPIDGTKYFMRGIPQYAISIALVEDHQPVLAVVYNPATNELFSAIRGGGARLNGQSIYVTEMPSDRPVLLVNPSGYQRGVFQPLDSVAECRPMGSIAYSLALIAAGRGDGTVNVDRLNEWDVAAGVLLIHEAGGLTSDVSGLPLGFNQPRTAIRGILASTPPVFPRLREFAHRLRG